MVNIYVSEQRSRSDLALTNVRLLLSRLSDLVDRMSVRAITRFEVDRGKGSEYAIGGHHWRSDPNAGDSNDHVRNCNGGYRMHKRTAYWPWIAMTGIAMGGCPGSLSKSGSLETPVLIGQVGGDQIAVAEAMSNACARVPVCKFVPFEGTRHVTIQ